MNHLWIHPLQGYRHQQSNRKNQNHLRRKHLTLGRVYHEVYQRHARIQDYEKIVSKD